MPRVLLVVLALALAVAGCGESSGPGSGSGSGGSRTFDVPEPDGRSLGAIAQKESTGGEEVVLTPGVATLRPGKQRVSFLLSDLGGKKLTGAKVALYVAPLEADGSVGDDPATGPWPVTEESAQTKTQFRSQSAAADPDAPKSFYVASPHFPLGGRYAVMALVSAADGKVSATDTVPVEVGPPSEEGPPTVGDRAVKVSTPTVASVSGDVGSIDTRTPPSSMHEVDFADVLRDGKPAVLLFATPALCQTAVCGPVVDVAEEVKASAGDDVAFIHMEIYRDNDVNKGERPQVEAWRLPSEPWAFVVDSRGRVAERFEGIFSVRELAAAVEKVR